MAACKACKELDGQLKYVAPHPYLKMLISANLGKGSMGLAIGFSDHYQCTACGTEMTCEDDIEDPLAGWHIAKEG